MTQHILAVDDRPENLVALEMCLEPLGVELVKACSGSEALAATLDTEFAVALLDVQMPEMDGYELAELLRGDPKTRALPIIFLTAYTAREEHIFKGYASGAVDYLVKPYQPAILRSKVGVLLELDALRRDLREQRDHLDALVAERTAELERANARLSRSNTELARYAHAASHDLREPLRMVSLYVERLAKRFAGSLDEEAARDMGFAIEGARRMNQLLDALLAIANIGTEQRPLQPVSCAELVTEAREALGDEIAAAEAVVDVGELPTVLGDRELLGKVFHQLLDNALKFRGDDPPKIEIDATERDDGAWQLVVADNGIGIEPAYHERVFATFERLHPRGQYAGNGIGLAIVKKVIEQHGGEVHVDSDGRRGARLCFTLPRQ